MPYLSHWSKDFVEHLRTVHFALITVSAGLILLLQPTRSYEPGPALKELDQIMDVQASWDFQRLVEAKSSEALYSSINSRPIGIGQPICELRYTDLASHPQKQRKSGPYDCHLEQRWFAFSPKPAEAGTARSRESEYSSMPPKTMAKFEAWWEGHKEPLDILVIEALADVSDPDIDYDEDSCGNDPVAADIASKCKPAPHRDAAVVLFDGEEDGRKTIGRLRLAYNDNYGFDSAEYNRFDSANPGSFRVESAKAFHANIPFPSIPIATSHTIKVSLDDFHLAAAGCRIFEQCFPELAKAVKGFEYTAFSDLRNHLVQQVEKGGEVFEAFGLKIPVQGLAVWGLVVLLGVQFYFYLHLRELHAKIEPDDSGWDAAWVGMYKSNDARMAFFASVALLPLVASGFLAYRGWQVLHDSNSRFPTSAAMVTYTLALGLSALLAFSAWKHRPRLEPIAEAMEDEAKVSPSDAKADAALANK